MATDRLVQEMARMIVQNLGDSARTLAVEIDPHSSTVRWSGESGWHNEGTLRARVSATIPEHTHFASIADVSSMSGLLVLLISSGTKR